MTSRKAVFLLGRAWTDVYIKHQARYLSRLSSSSSLTMTPPISVTCCTLSTQLTPLALQSQSFSSCNVLCERKWERKRDQSLREAAATLASDDRMIVKLTNRDGAIIGTMPKSKAQTMARKKNMKLLCVEEKNRPPIYQLVTGMELYEETMRRKREKSTTKLASEKVVRLSSGISEHDKSVKIKHIQDVVAKKHPVKIVFRTSSRTDSEEAVSEVQAQFFQQIRTDVPNGEVFEASRKATELIILIKPISNAAEEPQDSATAGSS